VILCFCEVNFGTMNHQHVFYVRRVGTISIAYLQESLHYLLFKLEADYNRLDTWEDPRASLIAVRVIREQNIVNQKSICLGASLLSGRGFPITSSSRTCFPARFTFNFREPEPETHVLQMLRVFPNATVAHFTQDILQQKFKKLPVELHRDGRCFCDIRGFITKIIKSRYILS